MSISIPERVSLANKGKLPSVIGKMKSGWAVLHEYQSLQGYCLLIADPAISSLNELGELERTDYLLDMCRIGDALLKVTNSHRINYETWCNKHPHLHTHIVPRFKTEDQSKIFSPTCTVYNWEEGEKFDLIIHQDLLNKLRIELSQYFTEQP